MSFMVSYTKSQYEAKITELKGYYSQLEKHLTTMEGYKDSMYDFWDDENARTTGEMLAIEIRQVRNAMDRTQDMLTFYESSVEKLDGANIGVASTIQQAIAILSGIGI
jgi:hypothetical protein